VDDRLARRETVGHRPLGDGECLVARCHRIIVGVNVRSDAGTGPCSVAAETVPVWREVPADRDVERATVDQPLRHLEDPLAVRLGADHFGAAVVLECRGQDLSR
jgi:hypothetical protein